MQRHESPDRVSFDTVPDVSTRPDSSGMLYTCEQSKLCRLSLLKAMSSYLTKPFEISVPHQVLTSAHLYVMRNCYVAGQMCGFRILLRTAEPLSIDAGIVQQLDHMT